ncbi:carbonic anhydrase family protein, partial [Brevundimonas sp. DC300-4]|uniref:carbonic anhydrase family protein n=1 Tax=Brevundimonas sp. DC300-4 TaxID=2804594 RepID=UPI003CF910B7
QVISNLISNAVKFTETGGVQVTARRHRDRGLCLSVSDTGATSAPLQAVIDSLGAPTAGPALDPNGLLPAGRDFFRYEGSLTTPPCSETVDWVVLCAPITVSQDQVDAFERLHPGNTRPIQPLHRRFLLRSGH